MKKFALGLFVFISFLLFPKYAHAANDFLCQCAVTGQFGACDGWQAADINCNDASQPVADSAHCGICGGAGSECRVACVAKTTTSTRNYGDYCTPITGVTITCNPDPADPSAAVTCRPAANNALRCLKTSGALNSGSGTGAGAKCKDSSECSGGSNSLCTNLPNTTGSGQQTFNVCTTEEYRNQYNCAQSGTVYQCNKKATTAPNPAAGGDLGVTEANVSSGCPGNTYVLTAVGCIPFGSVNEFAGFFLKWGLGFAGGIGMLFAIFASFQIMTSQGDPKRLQTGKELLTSAISGIILIVFSVFILRLLGVNILGLF